MVGTRAFERVGRGAGLLAVAIGACAAGVVAIGALAIGRLAIGRAKVHRLEIDTLAIGDLILLDQAAPAPAVQGGLRRDPQCEGGGDQ
jgi:hypothetical protein